MNFKFLRNVLLKGLLLFTVFNLFWAFFNPSLGTLSLYNLVLRGRERLPFGEDSSVSYNLSLYDLDAMFASLRLKGTPKTSNEFRVFVVGDSSTWGTLLRPQETLAGLLDGAGLITKDGRQVRVYNLGYPTLSLTKDLMILNQVMRYEPDLILWLVTLESFPRERQLESPIVANNLDHVLHLADRFDLDFDIPPYQTSFWEKTIIGQRRALADLLRLQLYGVMWSATGIDQSYPVDYEKAARDLEDDVSFGNWQPPTLPNDGLAWEVVEAGIQLAGEVPVVLINEPILISTGKNSQVRYNYYYPRWAYDQYRNSFSETCATNGWTCLDLWDAVSEERFTNSAIHLDPQGEELLANLIMKADVISVLIK